MTKTFEEILANEDPQVVEQAKAMATAMLLDINLAELRKRAELTQTQVGNAMGIKQPTVAGMEKVGQDIKLSSLKKYIEATGGKLRLDIEMSDFSHFGFGV